MRQAVMQVFAGLSGDAAVVLANWKAFGALSVPQ
jgi:hypothetical protein